MKFVDEFRDGTVARTLIDKIRGEADPGRAYRLMEFCGGHTHAIFRFGLPDLLPANVRMVHGPGCPVCVLPIGRLEMALRLAAHPDVILCTYGDMMRVPGVGRRTLFSAKAEGADVRMVYTVTDALALARANPGRTVVFFAIGFETTTPPTADAIRTARAEGLANFLVFCNHVLTPPAVAGVLDNPLVRGLGTVPIDGFIGPAHVSAVIGWRPFVWFAEEYARPVVVAGFEPLDVLQAILMLIRQINGGRAEVENEYSRVVSRDGNVKAQRLVAEVFELRRSFEWRGLGLVPYSALKIKEGFAAFDAERRFALPEVSVPDAKGCACAAILRGIKAPTDCALFGTVCTPDRPMGSCMVSSEGACAAYYRFAGHRLQGG